jgi:hypothetical protein
MVEVVMQRAASCAEINAGSTNRPTRVQMKATTKNSRRNHFGDFPE